MSSGIEEEIAELLSTTVREKLERYKPETVHMPFHHGLLGRDRYAMFSFIHSMNTTFGMSIWEQIAVLMAKGAGYHAERQYRILGEIDGDTEEVIHGIHYRLRKGETVASKISETAEIRDNIRRGQAREDPDSVADLYVQVGDEEDYFDITSAKPNMKEFAALKLKLLRWTALRLSQNKEALVCARLAIPYNPYHPEPYNRWTLSGLYDLSAGEILIGEEFWNFIANDNIYEDLIGVFLEVGEELRDEIDQKFSEFRMLGPGP